MSTSALVNVTKNTIRKRAARFASDHAADHSEQASRQTFWDEFFAIFGQSRRQVASFEFLAQRSSTGGIGWVDLLYPGEMGVEHKSAGENLTFAMEQLRDYLPQLHQSNHPWLLVVCDFKTFEWLNVDTGDSGEFALVDLPDNLHLFWWMAGYDRPGERFGTEEDANLKATGLLAAVHDELLNTGFDEHSLRQWITRILFCLFADDTGIWDRSLLQTYLAKQTRIDGSDLGRTLAEVFQILNTPPERRPPGLDEDLADLAYVNGDLFAEVLPIPMCNEASRTALLDACRFNWAAISPAIFGSLFQNVMTPKERRNLGAHYTSERNILRTIEPLFLDELRLELDHAISRPKLEAFHDKLGSLTFFDPACGCGNFLVVTYREIRRLETECLRRLNAKQKRTGQRAMNLELLCKVTVDQFYGIEIEEFPALIARSALYLADHLANREISAEFGEHFLRFPIPASPHIVIGNALLMEWNDVLSSSRASYVFGNPPFIGRGLLEPQQRAELQEVWGTALNANVDYVTGWFGKALAYLRQEPTARWAFVATNSLCQGESVPLVWSAILSQGWRSRFAHRSLRWRSDAKGTAAVHVSIVGFDKEGTPKPVLWTYADGGRGEGVEEAVSNINPYLTAGPNVIVEPRTHPLCGALPRVSFGNMARDGGHLLVEGSDLKEFEADPVAASYLRQFLGARELLHNEPRWCLWMEDLQPGDLARSPILKKRLAGVRATREASKAASTRAMAATPHLFAQRSQPATSYLAIPRHVSETRQFFPVRFCTPDVICGDANFLAPDPDGFLLGVLSSSMFIEWLRVVGGRLKSDLRFSKTLVYNTFPLPEVRPNARDRVVGAVSRLLHARSRYVEASLAELYQANGVPEPLVRAHADLDKAVDGIFGLRKVPERRARRTHLFRRYAELTGGDASLFDDL